MCERQQRGLVIAACSKVKPKNGSWLVPSQADGRTKYVVCPDENHPHCTCLDHETRGVVCKHIYAVRYTIKREYSDDGTVCDMETLVVQRVRKTYPQNWPAYNVAQTNEKSKFQTLLHDLCEGLNSCDQPSQGRGRPRIPMGDAIFAAAFKVYSTVSGRRFMSDLRDAHDKGFIDRLPSYNSIFNILDSEATSSTLQWLVCETLCRCGHWKPLSLVIRLAFPAVALIDGTTINLATIESCGHGARHTLCVGLKPMSLRRLRLIRKMLATARS